MKLIILIALVVLSGCRKHETLVFRCQEAGGRYVTTMQEVPCSTLQDSCEPRAVCVFDAEKVTP